jgi:hypothetical protein
MGILSTLRNISPSLYRLRILAIIVAILTVPLVLYYVVIVCSQTAYFTERSFRRLSLLGSQITSKVESVGVVLKNNSEKFINPKDPNTPEKFDPDPAQRDKNVDSLKKIFASLKDDSPQIFPTGIDPAATNLQKLAATEKIVTLSSARQDGDTPKVFFTYVTQSVDTKAPVIVHANTDLSNLLQPLLMTRTHIAGDERDQFENILVSETGTGRIIFQQDATEVRLASLAGLTLADDPGKAVDINQLGQKSSVIDVVLAGSRYKLFSHPVEISLPSDAGSTANTSWIVSGLIHSDSFTREAWSVSYTILIFCGFITTLLILSWPFLKLVLIGPKDRLGTADVYFLTFAVVVTLGVLTSFYLYSYSYLTLESLMESQLHTLADNVKINFKAELVLAVEQLDRMSKNCELLKTLRSTAPCSADTTAAANAIYHDGSLDKPNVLPAILGSPATYPYFDTAVWIDEKGMQSAKWTVKKETTQYIPVAGRAYFDNLRRGDTYQFGNYHFWLDPIVSKTTGRNEVEISTLAADPKWVTAFDTRLISLMQPVLPAGYGFVIITSDGNVLFHSDEAHHLGENFFQECDGDPELRSAVVSRSDVFMNVRYVGDGHAAFITTIDGFPQWSLVVFRNKQPLRSAFLELLTLASLIFLIYAVIILVCFSGFYLLNVRDERRAWLWPCAGRRTVYYQSFLLLLGIAIISALLVGGLHGQTLVAVIAGIGLLSAFIFFLNLRFGIDNLWPHCLSEYIGTTWLGRYEVAYVMNLAFLLLLIAVLPAAAFFKYAFESEMNAFIKHGQFTFASELTKRDQRIRTQYANTGQSESTGGTSDFVRRRSALAWDVYDHFFFGMDHTAPTVEKCPKEPPAEFLSELNTFVPLYNRISVERRGLLTTSTANGFCKWEPGSNNQLVLHLDRLAIGETTWPWRHLSTAVPGLGRPGPLWLLALLLAFIPFFLFLHFIVRKVFLLDIFKPTTHPLNDFLSEKIQHNLFVVVDAPLTTKSTCYKSNLCLKNFREEVNSPTWQEQLLQPAPPETVLAIDHFDYQSDDHVANQQKLNVIEKLIENNRKLLIFSAVEPSQYVFGNGDANHKNGEIEEAGRWAKVMSYFFTEYAEDTGNPKEFEKLVEEERTRILALNTPGRSNKEINELIDTLRAECIPKGPLQQVGLRILGQDSFPELGREHLLNRIVNQARPYYNHLWNSCSTPERVTLFHLAQDRLLSHRDPDIERLLRRELIVRDRDIHLLNDSFRQFIKSTEKSAFVAEEEHKAKQVSPWHTLKVPILVVLVAVTIFLFVTQRDLYTSALAIVTAVTTIIPAFFKLLTIFHSGPIARPPDQS